MKLSFDLPLFIIATSIACIQTDTSSEGNQFVTALPPANYTYYNAELIINARQTTTVTITTAAGSEVVTVYGNWSLHYDLDYSMRTTNGIEGKGVSITSTEPVTVNTATVSTNTYVYRIPDCVLVRPSSDQALEFVLAGFDYIYSENNYPKSFFMVVASDNDTEVDVFYADNGVTLEDEHFTLQQYEVFTRNAHYMADPQLIDFTGTRIVASKAVSVNSGDGVIRLRAIGGSTIYEYIVESMPNLEELGTEYTTFPLHFGGDGGYEVRIIAVHNDTAVTVPAFSTSLTLDTGDFHVVDNLETRLGFRISCSKPCMAVQYMKSLPVGGPDDTGMGSFMAVLVPEQRSSNSLIFTVPKIMDLSSDMKAAVSVIINSYPVTGLYLNETNLTDLDWQPVEESSNWFATVEIETGFYILHSTEAIERFTAYLYVVQSESSYIALGFPIGYAGDFKSLDVFSYKVSSPTEPPPITTTTPAPPGGERPPPPPPPLHRFVIAGNFTSDDGTDFSPQCAVVLGENFQMKATAMVHELNDMIGRDICVYVDAGDIVIVSVTSTFKPDGSLGVAEALYVLEGSTDVCVSDLTSCGEDLSTHLEDFDNWGRPVIPPVQDCPEPVFDPDYFFPVSQSSNWVCLSNLDTDVGILEADAPLYSLSVYDNFTIADGQELNTSCNYDYTMAWQTKTLSMRRTLNDKIANGNLCPEARGAFSVWSSSSTFSSQGSLGILTSTYFTQLEYELACFDDVHDCAYEMFVFLEDHSNWGSLPLLPQQPGCPELVFEPPQFYHNGESWHCATPILK